MDIKNIFLNSFITKKIFVEQPSDFENHAYPNHIFKLNKVLYGLKQALRAQYDRLNKFLLNNDFFRGSVDTTLFLKRKKLDLLVVQIYVDDIIFGSTNENSYQGFAKLMQDKFKMSMMGELIFFLGLQIKQMKKKFSYPKSNTFQRY